jgi:tetratricopeptide (TPR) repeat protein
MTKYKCPTLGDCERANTGEVFERAPGEDLKCPGCATLLEPQLQAETGRKPSLAMVAGIGAAIVLLAAGGGYAYLKQAPADAVVAQAAPEAAPVSAAAAAPAAATAPQAAGGIAPDENDTAILRREGEARLLDGQAQAAEAAGSKAAANEMMKLAIAKMAQGKLDEAEKELEAARARAPQQPLVYYNLAVLRLKQDRTDDALKQFEASFMAGFDHFNEMDKDPDLAALRADPRFDGLVKKYRKGV